MSEWDANFMPSPKRIKFQSSIMSEMESEAGGNRELAQRIGQRYSGRRLMRLNVFTRYTFKKCPESENTFISPKLAENI